ncbi:MAG TPA: glycoside hydrolase family 88 protein [Opitutales bacterium]|nr:glycoside hydrolase family 88 protein [Opitutales bacterium]
MKLRALPCAVGAALAVLAAALAAADSPPAPASVNLPQVRDGTTRLEWAQRMADSEIKRLGVPATPKWDYTSALFATSLLELGNSTPLKNFTGRNYRDYVERLIGGCVNAEGNITSYKAGDHSLDEVAPARVLVTLYTLTGDARYKKAADLVHAQFKEQPRTSDGGFWHKQGYPNQMWLDGLYMGEPFYAAYAKVFNQPSDFDDITKQILLADQHTYDPKTGLFYHGWDDTRKQSWADPATGHSPSFWGRGEGWYAMAMVDVLEDLPADHPNRVKILDVLHRLADGLVRWQDPQTGLWWQVLDQGSREGNYLEASGSSMFVYALAKAVNHGWLPKEKYAAAALRGFDGLTNTLVKSNADGSLSLTQICETAGLGRLGNSGAYRDGTFDYYVHQTRMVNDDLKGVGAFVLAGVEADELGVSDSKSNHAAEGQPAAASSTVSPRDAANAADLTPEQVAQFGWEALPQILAHIKEPTFPDKNFPITDYGAKADGTTDCTDAIRQAIAACHAAGGGHVVVPEGTFLTGGIQLLSNVDLHLTDSAVLQFVPDPAKYPRVLVRHEGVERTDISGPIYAFEQENIAVTGKGVLDGGGERNWVAQVGANSRPNFIVPLRCKNVLIDGLTIHDSPMWEINPVYCTNVIVRNLNISSHDANNDGCDPDSCKYVLIDHCTFDTGDDCIAIKCGKDDDGRRVNVPTEFVIVRNCTMKDGHGGVTLGSECTPAIRNVFVEDCVMSSPNLNAFFRFKDSPARGGIIENAYMRNVQVGTIARGNSNAGILIQYNYQYTPGRTPGNYTPILRNVNISNVTGANVPRLVILQAPANAVIENISVSNCTFTGPNPNELDQFAGKIKFDNVKILIPTAVIPPPGSSILSADWH